MSLSSTSNVKLETVRLKFGSIEGKDFKKLIPISYYSKLHLKYKINVIFTRQYKTTKLYKISIFH